MKEHHLFTGYNTNLKPNARQLRKNMTRHEKKLWYDFLRNRPEKWYKQRVISQYIVDFYCSAANLIIEIDGSQHYTSDGMEYDEIRTEILEKYDLEVIRFSNIEIDRNFENVCLKIERILTTKII